MVGHGSSDNAASYGVYAFGLGPRWTAFRDSISLTVHYGTKLDMTGTTAIALSQSGQTPDVVAYLEQALAIGELGQPVAFEGEQVWLAPGQGCLLKLD